VKYPLLTTTAEGAGTAYDAVITGDGQGTSSHTAVQYLAANAARDNMAAKTNLAVGTVTFTPTIAGTYTLVVWNESSNVTSEPALSGTESYQTFTITVAAGVGSVTLTPINATAAAGNTTATGGFGSLVKVSLKDAAGNATTLAPGEFVTLTPTSGGIVKFVNKLAAGSVAATPYNLSAANFDSTGTAWVNITNAAVAEDIVTLTATTAGGVGSSTTLTFEPVQALDYDPVAYGTSGFVSTTAATAVPLGTKAITWQVVGTASLYQQFAVVDTRGMITGATVTGLAWNAAVKGSALLSGTIAAGTAFYSVTATIPGATTVAAVYTVDTLVGTATPNVVAAALVAAGAGTVTPSSINAIVGSTNSVRVLLKDSFKNVYASQTLTATVTGKNPTVVAQSAVTDATGYATFTFVDANSNTASQDVITITGAGLTPAVTVTISYGLNAVEKVLVTSGDTAAGVNALSATPSDIAAGLAGPTANLAAISASVTNAAGAALSGVPVVFTVSGTGAAIPSNKITVYTDTTGVATSSVYGWIAGSYTVTATAGGKTGTGLQSFNQQTATEVRTISATVTGNSVTAVAKDRFGNPVVGAILYAVASAGSSIGGSLVSSTPATDKNGSVTWIVTGSGSVKVTTINPSIVSTLATDQSTAAAGYVVGDVVLPVVFTATTVGTTVTAETGVGAALAPAGISAVTVAVDVVNASETAADAAAEATDAANAATDAANAAAEAADAATAAAQDAADAVAALSTQVSEMVNALKKQITALTNLVIKIQKKVKA
jgi:hypothetical protein